MIDQQENNLAHTRPDRDGVVTPHIAGPVARRRIAISQTLEKFKHLTITRRRLSLAGNPGIRRSVV